MKSVAGTNMRMRVKRQGPTVCSSILLLTAVFRP